MLRSFFNLILLILLSISPYYLSAADSKSKTNPTKVGKKTKKEAKKKLKTSDKIRILEAQLKKNPDNKRYQKVLAKLYLKNKDYEKAVEVYQQLLEEGKLESYLDLAKAYRLDKNYLSEIRVLNQLLPRWPNYPNLYYLQANAYIKIDKLDDAAIKYRKALSIQPKYEDAYWGIFRLFELKKNRYEARLILLDMIKQFGDKAKFYTNLCRLYTADSYFEEALSYCQVAVRLSPKRAENHVNLGLTHQFKKNQVQAMRILSNAARQFPKNAYAQQSAGKILAEKENFELSSKYYKKCTRLEKDNAECWKGLGQSAFQIGKYKESLNAYKKVCQMDRTILTEFKKQAALLRIHGKSSWHEKFTQGITNCYY